MNDDTYKTDWNNAVFLRRMSPASYTVVPLKILYVTSRWEDPTYLWVLTGSSR